MKKIFKIFGILLMLVSLTGCYKINMEMGISSDKTLNYKAVVAVNKTLLESMSEGEEFDLKDSFDEAAYQEAGFKTEEYKYTDSDGNEWVGYSISKDLGNIDDMLLDRDQVVDMNSSEDMSGNDSVGSGVPSKLFSKNGDVYKAQLLFDFSVEENEMMDTSEMANLFDLYYQITLPSPAISNNADSVTNGGKTLKWNLVYGKKTNVNFEFKVDGSTGSDDKDKDDDDKDKDDDDAKVDDKDKDDKSDDDKKEEKDKKDKKDSKDDDDKKNNMILYIGIGGGAALLLIVVIVVVSSKKKKKNINQDMNTIQPTMNMNMNMMQQPNNVQQPVGGQQPYVPQPPVNQQPVQETLQPVQQPVVQPAPEQVQQPVDMNNNQQPPMQ